MTRKMYDKNGKEVHKGDTLKVWMGLEKCLQKYSYFVNDVEELYNETVESDEYMRITDMDIKNDNE